jgi:hypothetical protein
MVVTYVWYTWLTLTLGSQGQCSNSNQAFLLVQKLEISPKGFTLGVKAEIEKKSVFNLPQVTNKC